MRSGLRPALNSLFLAWNVLSPGYAAKTWKWFQEDSPKNHPALHYWLDWREIAPRPGNAQEARERIYAVIDQHVHRLSELMARNEATEVEEYPERADRAALDCSTSLDRHRRYQSARTRELHRTLETLNKMRKLSESETRIARSGLGDVAPQSVVDRGGLADESGQMTCENCNDQIGQQDSTVIVDDSGCDTIGESCPEVHLDLQQSAQNEAKIESLKRSGSPEFGSRSGEFSSPKRTHSPTSLEPTGQSGQEPISTNLARDKRRNALGGGDPSWLDTASPSLGHDEAGRSNAPHKPGSCTESAGKGAG